MIPCATHLLFKPPIIDFPLVRFVLRLPAIRYTRYVGSPATAQMLLYACIAPAVTCQAFPPSYDSSRARLGECVFFLCAAWRQRSGREQNLSVLVKRPAGQVVHLGCSRLGSTNLTRRFRRPHTHRRNYLLKTPYNALKMPFSRY